MRVEVALPISADHTFTYAVPEPLRPKTAPGMRVVVPFRNRQRVGWIVEETAGSSETPGRVRDVLAIPDDEPALTAPLLELCRWMAGYYLTPLGLTIRTAQPRVLVDTSEERVRRTGPSGPGDPPDPEEGPSARLLDTLDALGGEATFSRLRRALGPGRWRGVVDELIAEGRLRRDFVPPRVDPPVRTRRVLTLERELPSLRQRDEVFGRAVRQRELYELLEEAGGGIETAELAGKLGFSYAIQRGLVDRGLARIEEIEERRDPYAAVPAEERALPPLTPAQSAAVAAMEAVRGEPGGSVLLHGVTGSGKTRVYIEVLRRVVAEEGRGAIVLVPEIALTPQTVARFRAEFGDDVAVLHSALSDGERYDEWRSLRDGVKRIAVGARSAVFAPVRGLGAVIVDEEHESSYKQSEAPRYNARDIALVRAKLEGALCVLGSATPSLESWHNAATGKHHLARLPERIGHARLPRVSVTTREWVSGSPLSERLRAAIAERLARGEQSILLLNRRGYATMATCRACGHVWECPSCSVALTLHRRLGRLVCHHCLRQTPAPRACAACGEEAIGYSGLGTEQLERVVSELFPTAAIARMDVDTTTAKWAHHDILERVRKREVDILLGTQMIAKGLDFPNVTLVGVVSADTGIHMPDFRAAERTFQLLTQVAGRAGREERPGEVVIQTSMADHDAIRCAVRHDFEGFAEKEMREREAIGYPPYGRLANVVLSDRDAVRVETAALALARRLAGGRRAERQGTIRVLGPAPCPIGKLRDRWRWHLLLLSPRAADLGGWLGGIVRWSASPEGRAVRVTVDRDPVSLL